MSANGRDDGAPNGEPNVLLEAEAETGVVTVPLSKYVQLPHAHMPRGRP